MSAAFTTSVAPASPGILWQRRVVIPLIIQLKQGITPDRLALTISLGGLLSLFPILGLTTLLCGFAAAVLRLNQPIIQTVNLLVCPLQLALLIPFYRAGEWLLGRDPVPLNIPLLFERFAADVGKFFADFGMIAVGGILVWTVAAPVAASVIYFIVRPLLRALADGIRAPSRRAAV